MKTIFIALLTLIFSLSFSGIAEAKKTGINAVSASPGSRDREFVVEADDQECTYHLATCLFASVSTHRNNTLALQVVTDDAVGSIHTWLLPDFKNYTALRCAGSFTVPRGQLWSLVWVLESSQGKGRIIDAVEQFASSCPSL